MLIPPIQRRRLFFASTVLGFLSLPIGAVYASHWWNNYHWFTLSTSVAVQVGDNVSPDWDPVLALAVSDLSTSGVIDLTTVPSGGDPVVCNPVTGRIEVCSADYGDTGWGGLTQVWEDTNISHVNMARAVVNDYYYGPADISGKRSVMCQEVAHALGLDHQDVDAFNLNLGSCMDYTNHPQGTPGVEPDNEHPNAHDFSQFSFIYSHNHSIASSSQASSQSSATSSASSHTSSAVSSASSYISSTVSSASSTISSNVSSASSGSTGSAAAGCIQSFGDANFYPTYCSICNIGNMTTCVEVSPYDNIFGCQQGACVSMTPGDTCLAYFNNAIWATHLRCFERNGIQACFHGDQTAYGWSPCP